MLKSYYYIDLDVTSMKIISWGISQTACLTGATDSPNIHRVFLTKGQYYKMEKLFTK
jgi:hypothetical protein